LKVHSNILIFFSSVHLPHWKDAKIWFHIWTTNFLKVVY